jgi:hypothetical protein
MACLYISQLTKHITLFKHSHVYILSWVWFGTTVKITKPTPKMAGHEVNVKSGKR